MSRGWGSHRIRQLILLPSEVLWALTSLKSHQRETRTMRATRMISPVLSHTRRQYLCSSLVTFPCFHLLHTLYFSLSYSLAPLLEFLLIRVDWLSLEVLALPMAEGLNYRIFKFPSNTNNSVIVDPSTWHLCFWCYECHPQPVRNSTNKWGLKHFHVRALWKYFVVLGNTSFWQPSTELICE